MCILSYPSLFIEIGVDAVLGEVGDGDKEGRELVPCPLGDTSKSGGGD